MCNLFFKYMIPDFFLGIFGIVDQRIIGTWRRIWWKEIDFTSLQRDMEPNPSYCFNYMALNMIIHYVKVDQHHLTWPKIENVLKFSFLPHASSRYTMDVTAFCLGLPFTSWKMLISNLIVIIIQKNPSTPIFIRFLIFYTIKLTNFVFSTIHFVLDAHAQNF